MPWNASVVRRRGFVRKKLLAVAIIFFLLFSVFSFVGFVSADSLPDLEVKKITKPSGIILKGDSVTFNAEIKNIGTAMR